MEVVQNCAPAVSADGSKLYLAVSDAKGAGYLLALDAATLEPLARVRLKDPATGDDSLLVDEGTSVAQTLMSAASRLVSTHFARTSVQI